MVFRVWGGAEPLNLPHGYLGVVPTPSLPLSLPLQFSPRAASELHAEEEGSDPQLGSLRFGKRPI